MRNDLFEKIIKSCKATNTEFLMLKEKLGICLYEENCYEEEIIKIQDDIEETDKEPIEVIGKVSSEKSTKKLTKKLIVESGNESDKESDNESNKKSIKEMFEELSKESEEEFIKDLLEIRNLNNNKNTTDWYDKNKFKKILTIIENNGFNHKNKIGKLRFNNINNLIINIKNNTISEADTKKKINKLNEIKKAETKNKRLINGQKILLSLFNDLVEAIFNNNKFVNEDNIKIVNEGNNEIVNEDNNVNDNDDNDNDDDEITVKGINNDLKKNDETKSFEDQINILKKIPWLNEYWDMCYYEDNKETNLRLFKLTFAHTFNDVDDDLFK